MYERLSTGAMPANQLAAYLPQFHFFNPQARIALLIHACFLVLPAWGLLIHRPRGKFLLAWIAIFFACALVVFFAGSARYLGAPILAALGAARAGAGLVTLACVEGVATAAAGRLPEITYLPLSSDAFEALADYDALVFGPGLGRDRRLHRVGRPVRTFSQLPRAGGPGQGKGPNTGRFRAWKALPSRQRVWLRRARPRGGCMAPCGWPKRCCAGRSPRHPP